MRKINLNTKLIGSFLIVATIALIVGLLGIRGVHLLGGHLDEVGNVSLTGIQNLAALRETMVNLAVSQNRLLNPTLSIAERQAEQARIDHSVQQFEAAWQKVAALPKTPEEKTYWQKLNAARGIWEEALNDFRKVAVALEQTDIPNPVALVGKLDQIAGDYYRQMNRLLDLIDSGDP